MKAVIRAAEVRAAQIFASKDETKPVLTGVNVEVRDGVASVVATDSYRLVAMESQNADNEDGSVTVDFSGLKLGKNDYLAVEHAEGGSDVRVEVVGADTVLTVPAIEGKYPGWRCLLPKEEDYEAVDSVSFVAKHVDDLAKAYKAWSGKGDLRVWLRFTGQDKMMVMSDESKDCRFHALVMPRRAEAPC